MTGQIPGWLQVCWSGGLSESGPRVFLLPLPFGFFPRFDMISAAAVRRARYRTFDPRRSAARSSWVPFDPLPGPPPLSPALGAPVSLALQSSIAKNNHPSNALDFPQPPQAPSNFHQSQNILQHPTTTHSAGLLLHPGDSSAVLLLPLCHSLRTCFLSHYQACLPPLSRTADIGIIGRHSPG
jgi:hypothetical protein